MPGVHEPWEYFIGSITHWSFKKLTKYCGVHFPVVRVWFPANPLAGLLRLLLGLLYFTSILISPIFPTLTG